MTRFKRFIQTTSRAAMVLTAAWALAQTGCGNLARSPMGSPEGASDAVVLTQAQPAGYLVFSQRAAVRAAKKVKVELASGVFSYQDAEWFESDDNEKLEVEFEDYGDKETIRVKKATFQIKKNSIDLSALTPEQLAASVIRDDDDEFECRIEMAVFTGLTLDDVVVAFGPGGLKFDPIARLEIQLKGALKNVIPEGKSSAYHIDDAGNITQVAMDVDLKSNGGKLRIDVPGFSRYGLDP